MKAAQKNILTVTAQVWNWSSYAASFAPLAWWRMRDTSGTNVVNSGSLGSAVDLTAIAWTMAQAGQLGAGEAGLTDGSTTRLQCANNATLAGLTDWEWVFLIKPTGAGEGNKGMFFGWGDTVNQPTAYFNNAVNTVIAAVYNTTPTAFVTTCTTGPTANVWCLLFIAYKNSGDRKLHLYKGVSGVVTELTYSAQPALTGTYRTPTEALNLFNRSLQDYTFAGLGDEVFAINGNLTAAQRTQLCVLAGV